MTDKKGMILLATLLVLLVLWRTGMLTPEPPGPVGKLAEITGESFDPFLQNGLQPVIVDFYAAWCGPCRKVKPILAQLSLDLEGRARFAMVNTELSSALADENKVTGIPCVILFKNGIEVSRKVGGFTREEYLAWITPHLSRTSPPATQKEKRAP